MMRDGPTAYPLAWPAGWPRETLRLRSRFHPRSLNSSARELFAELRMMGVRDDSVVVSTNVELRLDGLPYSNRKSPDDPGVAVYFDDPWRRAPAVLACDRWDRVEDNLWAVALHVRALRAIERHGVGSLERAFTGYKALPDGSGRRAWWHVLGFDHEPTLDEARAQYRLLARSKHPDHGGDAGEFARITAAWAEARSALPETPTPTR